MGRREAKWDPRRGCIVRVEKTWRETVAFCISGTQENERAQHGAWQVLEVHRMSVLSSVPEIRSSGGWGGIRMEVPAQRTQVLWLPRWLEE